MAQTIDQVLQQMNASLMAMGDRVGMLENQLGASMRQSRTLEQELTVVQNRLAVAESTAAAPASHAHGEATRGGLYDKRLYEPEKLHDVRD